MNIEQELKKKIILNTEQELKKRMILNIEQELKKRIILNIEQELKKRRWFAVDAVPLAEDIRSSARGENKIIQKYNG